MANCGRGGGNEARAGASDLCGFFWRGEKTEAVNTRGFTNLTRNNAPASFRLRSHAVKVIWRRVLL